MPPATPFTEADARAVLLVRAAEDADSPLWTSADAAWATRLAREPSAAPRSDAAFVAARAGHALQRLLPRAPVIAAWFARRRWRAGWLAAAALAAALAGLLVDQIGGTQRINLLAPPVWALVIWNIVVVAHALARCAWRGVARLAASLRPAAAPQQARGSAAGWLARWGLRRSLAPAAAGAASAEAALLRRFAERWIAVATPLAAARAALLLHVAAAALALGVIGGLYLRGLALDYRAGWQSTFLEAPTVQRLLDAALAPASRASGIAVPDVAPLRVAPGGIASGPAAPWLHLVAMTLVLFVVGPRALLAGVAALTAWRRARRIALPLDDPYFARLLAQREGRAPRVRVQPVGYRPSPQAVLALREHLVQREGDGVLIDWGDPVEADADAPPAASAATPPALWLALFDLAATPEDEVHGRWLRERRAALPALAIAVDASGWRQRFATLPERLAERSRLWHDFAAGLGLRCDIV